VITYFGLAKEGVNVLAEMGELLKPIFQIMVPTLNPILVII
jgi:hypothetical protein